MTSQDLSPSGGTFCSVFCKAMNVDFSSVDYKEGHRSLLNLGVSGDRGCPRCQLLYEACLQYYPFLKDKTSRTLVRLKQNTGSFGEIEPMEIELKSVPSIKRFSLNIYLAYSKNRPPPDWIPLPPRRMPFFSRQTQFQELLLDWLDDCNVNHYRCKRTSSPLPTRVIDVGDSKGSQPFLYVSKGEEGRYVALSHCWGDVLLTKTDKENLADHQNRILFDILPKTFQDAITVARAIGVQYIWIDALCIIQDDAFDWEVESSKMATIYHDAYVVLIASNAADSQAGLWNKEWDSHWQVKGGVKEFPCINNDGSVSHIIARKDLSHGQTVPEGYLREEAPSPLSKRGWTLQEEFLAYRCVFFTGKELLWRCQRGVKCECMQEDAQQNQLEPLLQPLAIKSRPPKKQLRKLFHHWLNLMAEYSVRRLTYEHDRMAAISGIAKHFQSMGAGKYLAGMWMADLLTSLLWRPNSHLEHHNPISTYRVRASSYRAPSWSWISLDTNDGKGKPGCPTLYPSVLWFTKAVAKTIDARCEPAGIDDTGAIKSGYIILQSKCLVAWVEWKSCDSKIFYNNVPLHVSWDIDLEIGLKQEIRCFLIGIDETRVEGIIPVYALILRQSKKVEGAFERVGLCDPYDKNVWNLCKEVNEESIVTII